MSQPVKDSKANSPDSLPSDAGSSPHRLTAGDEKFTSRWSLQKAADWQRDIGWRVGCNFTPSTAANQLEMWQSDTYDRETISRELGWAASIGLNTVRVYLHDLLFEDDPTEFLDRVDDFLSIAAGCGIGAIPVLFDGVWNTKPKVGDQPAPIPMRHNSVWVQGPGAAIFYDSSRWAELQPYVHGVLSRFATDQRILAWDVFNEPDQVDTVTLRAGSRQAKIATATELVSLVFQWCREIGPTQPLTVGVWEYEEDGHPTLHSLNSIILELSDVISFHCYEQRPRLEQIIAALRTHKRPLLCTEWLARSVGSGVDLLQVFADARVGAINWGLVDGKTQTRFPWRSWTEDVTDDEPWFHELLHSDGSYYDASEIDVFQRIARSMR